MHAAPARIALLVCVGCGVDPAPTQPGEAPVPVAQPPPGAVATPQPVEIDRPNIVIVDIDSLRADRLDAAYAGRPVMPNLRALASRGVRFDEMISQSGWTPPAVQALLTGRYARMAQGAPPPGYTPPVMLQDLAQLYGYHTAALWAGGPARLSLMGELKFAWSSVIGPDQSDVAHLDAEIDTWLSQAAQEPFLLLVHNFDAHVPGPGMSRDHAHRFETAPGAAPCPMGGYDDTYRGLRDAVGEDAARAHAIAHYDGVLGGYDDVLGHLFAVLSDRGLDPRTWVVVTSNHGEDLYVHQDSLTHGASYDDLLRVPLVVAGPGVVDPGRTVDAVVQTVDVMPTLLDLARIPADHQSNGLSLRPWLESASPADMPTDRMVLTATNANNLAVRTRRYKLLQRTANGDWHPGSIDGRARGRRAKAAAVPEAWFALYDLAADPQELNDIYAQGAPADLVAALDEWRAWVQGDGTVAPISDEAREALQRQGYWGIASEPPVAPPTGQSSK